MFFSTDFARTLSLYSEKVGFDWMGTWDDPPVYAIVARVLHAIHFRSADPLTANPDKYLDELLDAYLLLEDAEALYAECTAKGVEFPRGSRQHVVAMAGLSRRIVRAVLLAFGWNPSRQGSTKESTLTRQFG